MKTPFVSLFSLALLATACSQIPNETYFHRGSPESLLDISTEVVNVPLRDAASIGELSATVNQDPPTRVELGCSSGTPQCVEAETLLKQIGVPYSFSELASGNAVLHYERVIARDCDPHYVDNPINPYNLNHPSLGCSIAANIVQMAGDKKQLVSPDTLGRTDALKASQIYGVYATKPEKQAQTSSSGDLLKSTK